MKFFDTDDTSWIFRGLRVPLELQYSRAVECAGLSDCDMVIIIAPSRRGECASVPLARSTSILLFSALRLVASRGLSQIAWLWSTRHVSTSKPTLQVAGKKHHKVDQPLRCFENDGNLFYGLGSYESLPLVATLVKNSNQQAEFLRNSAYHCYVWLWAGLLRELARL